MPADYSKILDHPNCDEIVSKLMTGVDPKDISDWLKIKYDKPEQSHLKIPMALMKSFYNDGSIEMYRSIKKDIAIVKSQTGALDNKSISDSLKNNKTYKQKIEELAGSEIDILRSIENLLKTALTRTEQIYDLTQQNPSNTRPDNILLRYYETISNMLEKFYKMQHSNDALTVNNTIINNNLNVQYIDDNIAQIQAAIRETCEELDPDIAFLFMEKLSQKMSNLKEIKPEPIQPIHKRLEQVNKLTTASDIIIAQVNEGE